MSSFVHCRHLKEYMHSKIESEAVADLGGVKVRGLLLYANKVYSASEILKVRL